jgi:hypothetical protein
MNHTLCDWFGWFCRGGNPSPYGGVAPEIDPTGLVSAIALVAGMLAVWYGTQPRR